MQIGELAHGRGAGQSGAYGRLLTRAMGARVVIAVVADTPICSAAAPPFRTRKLDPKDEIPIEAEVEAAELLRAFGAEKIAAHACSARRPDRA